MAIKHFILAIIILGITTTASAQIIEKELSGTWKETVDVIGLTILNIEIELLENGEFTHTQKFDKSVSVRQGTWIVKEDKLIMVSEDKDWQRICEIHRDSTGVINIGEDFKKL